MTGFQIFLSVIFGIIALFVLILSIPLKISIGYDDKIHLSVKYLFIKLDILPAGPKKKKAPKKEKAEKPKKEPAEKQEKPKEKKPNPILEMVKANGHDGMMLVLSNLGKVMKIYSGKLFKSVVFDEIYLYIRVGTSDSAQTAIKYGEICQKVYPLMGFICSNNLVHKYDINVEPDFLAPKTESEFYCDVNITLRKIINSSIGMVVRLIFKVVLTFLKGAKKAKAPTEENTQTVNN